MFREILALLEEARHPFSPYLRAFTADPLKGQRLAPYGPAARHVNVYKSVGGQNTLRVMVGDADKIATLGDDEETKTMYTAFTNRVHEVVKEVLRHSTKSTVLEALDDHFQNYQADFKDRARRQHTAQSPL